VLACGGCELIEKAAMRADVTPISTHLIASQPALDLKHLRTELSVYWNAIKHFSASPGRNGKPEDEAIMATFSG